VGPTRLLGPLSFALPAGRLLAILGPNGAGKSTLLLTLAGLLAPAEGEVRLDGRPLATLSARARARAIGFLPQGGEVAWNLSARAVVALGRAPHLRALGGPAITDRNAIARALAATDAAHLADRPIRQLSGGERARVLLARVLAGEPRVLLADEPLQNLDPAHQLRVADLLGAAAREGRAVAAIVHDLPQARRMADDVLMIADGALVAHGPAADALTPQTIARTFGVHVSPDLVPVGATR
ncbi:MAG: ABC transporter ATP-binding protein, partial [Sphingomonadaceae bacterium]